MGEYLRRMWTQDWRPTSRYSVAAWLVFYIVFLLYAFSKHGAFLFIDLANLVVHEGGHLLFGWFGPTLGLWGGTILQWLVPLLLAAYFFSQRQTTAFAFCSFFFFEIRRTVSSVKPRGAASASKSVTKPYSYSLLTNCSMVSVAVLIIAVGQAPTPAT